MQVVLFHASLPQVTLKNSIIAYSRHREIKSLIYKENNEMVLRQR